MTRNSGILHDGWGGQMLFVQHFAYAHLITHVADVTALPGATSNLPEGGAFNGTATYVLCRRIMCSILVKLEVVPAVPEAGIRVYIDESTSRGLIQSVPTSTVIYTQTSDECLLKNSYLLSAYNQRSVSFGCIISITILWRVPKISKRDC
jgi:hypothetical protein